MCDSAGCVNSQSTAGRWDTGFYAPQSVTFTMKCQECGREINSGTYIAGRLCCPWCVAKLAEKAELSKTYQLPSNWCPLHGAWATGIPQCPGCYNDPPGLTIVTTSGTEVEKK
jgi:hypothetical protein